MLQEEITVFDNLREKMSFERVKKTVREIVDGYVNNDSNGRKDVGGVTAMNGKLIVRPRFQRSYIRADDIVWKRKFIESIICNYPTGTYYWGNNEDGTFDNIDGQQRTITICDFIKGDFSIIYDGRTHYFYSLPANIQKRIMDYNLDVSICTGSQSDKLKWFEIINQPISELTKQELRNAVYNGYWLEIAKQKFSAPQAKVKRQVTDKNDKYCAHRYGKSLKIERQDILEMVLDWASAFVYPNEKNRDKRIEMYMAAHQNDTEMTEWDFYKKVIDWIWNTFLDVENNPHSSRKIKGTPHSMVNVNWGKLYAEYHDKEFDTKYLSKRLIELLSDDDVVKKHCIYEYLLDGEKNPNLLQIRQFNQLDIEKMYKYQGGVDPIDNKAYDLSDMEAHHIKSWSDGGKSSIENLVLVSKQNHIKIHNRGISSKDLTELRDKLWSQNDFISFIKYDNIRQLDERYGLNPVSVKNAI